MSKLAKGVNVLSDMIASGKFGTLFGTETTNNKMDTQTLVPNFNHRSSRYWFILSTRKEGRHWNQDPYGALKNIRSHFQSIEEDAVLKKRELSNVISHMYALEMNLHGKYVNESQGFSKDQIWAKDKIVESFEKKRNLVSEESKSVPSLPVTPTL
ncbi:hypothetical protein BDA99DRAFT_558387 [Phascolomyces articulosus]|uniref:Uncharacterized protein n=1 Tax=Phascolomyces articulosus TaxID=60185 RepID=A0AAD5PG36_9FUNG|nr:hypothetical protein BDA99DRAFT_558387 [Phascolomyces articulosus]